MENSFYLMVHHPAMELSTPSLRDILQNDPTFPKNFLHATDEPDFGRKFSNSILGISLYFLFNYLYSTKAKP